MASGSVRKLPGTDRAKPYRVQFREYPNSPKKYRHFKLKKEADAFLAKILRDLSTGSYVDPGNGRLGFHDYAEQWRGIQVHAHATEVGVEQQLRLHVYPIIGHRPIGAIRPSEIQGLVRHLHTKLAPSTIEVVLGRVSAVFTSAVKDRIVAVSPCIDIKLPDKKPANTLQVLAREQVLELVEAVPHRYRAETITAAGTGLRPGERWGLTVDRVDFLRHQLRVDQQLVRVRGQGVVLTPKLKTKTSYRTVPLAEPVAQAIAAHLERYGPHPDLNLVFTNEWGGPIQQYPFGQMFENARVRAGIPAWVRGEDIEPPTPHDLRHFYASVLIRSGASIKVVQARLGHASAKVTLDTYSHLFADEEDRTRQAVEDLFAEPVEAQSLTEPDQIGYRLGTKRDLR